MEMVATQIAKSSIVITETITTAQELIFAISVILTSAGTQVRPNVLTCECLIEVMGLNRAQSTVMMATLIMTTGETQNEPQ